MRPAPRARRPPFHERAEGRVKLSVFTPLPPAPTGIADYSELLLRELDKASNWEVEAYCEGEARKQPFPVHDAAAATAGATGLAMYHVGNSDHHDFLYPQMLARPGVLVLHDLVLHHARLRGYLESPVMRAYRADLGNRDKRDEALATLDAYREEVMEAYPDKGDTIAEIAIRMGGGRLLYAYPLYEHLVRRSQLTLVHSSTARDEILEHCPDVNAAKVARVRMGMPLPIPMSREEARKKLGLGDGLLLASFGLVTPEKRIGMALKALARLRARGVDARYMLVGDKVDHYDAAGEAEALGVKDAVHIAGRVSDEDFWPHIFAADICLNLRFPSAGETSATLLRLLACGRPVMVTDQIHAADFPCSVVARTSLEGDEDGLYCDLMDLIRSTNRRRDLAIESRAFVEREHSPEAMVADYLEALRAVVRIRRE